MLPLLTTVQAVLVSLGTPEDAVIRVIMVLGYLTRIRVRRRHHHRQKSTVTIPFVIAATHFLWECACQETAIPIVGAV